MGRTTERVVIGFVAGVLLAGCAKRAAKGEGYHFEIPTGYSQPSAARIHLPPRALAVLQNRRVADDYFIASLVVTPIDPTTPPMVPGSAELCAQSAHELANSQAASVVKSGIVATPFGQSCQFDLMSTKDNHAVRFTVMAGPKAMWGLTCNHDPRDTAAVEACQQVITTWKWE